MRPSPAPVDRVELTAALNAFLRGDGTVTNDGRPAVTPSDSLA